MIVPHEVPPPPRVFVNREPDFAWMADFWSARARGAFRVGVLTGLAGVGKSAFVRRCVEQVQADKVFAGGELYVDFRSVEGERISVADALAACLRAVGVALDAIPATLAERANLLRSITAQRPVLIVLENVTDPAQVLPFVPNTAMSAVLVTSTSRLTDLELDGAAVRRLSPFDGADGAQLIAELVGIRAHAEPDAVSELVRQCAGLPVALRIVAAKLVARPSLRIESVVVAIAAAESGLAPFSAAGKDTLSAAFSEAYAELDDVSARVYRLVGLFPGQDLSLDTVQALAAGDPALVEAAVATLIEADLLAEDSSQRLSMHDLVKRHAAWLCGNTDSDRLREDALRRGTRHLLIRAALADLAAMDAKRYRCTPATLVAGYRSPFVDRQTALDWLDAERMNLLAVQRAAIDAGWHDWAWQLGEALSALYVTRRYYTDWTISAEISAISAHAAGNLRAEARARSFASRAWVELGRLDRAREELIVKALPLAEATGDGRLLASVWELIGRYRDVAEPEAASAAYQHSLELFRAENDTRGEAFVMYFFAVARRRAGDLEQAEEMIQAALPLIREVGDPRMEGRALIDFADILEARGRRPSAYMLLDEAAALLAADGHSFYEAKALESRVQLAERDNDVHGQREALRRMVEIHRDLGSGRAEELAQKLERLTDE